MARPKGIPSDKKGKSYEEIYGEERADILKKNQRENHWFKRKGAIPSFLGKTHTRKSKKKISTSRTGVKSHRKSKTYLMEFGFDVANLIKKKQSLAKLGKVSGKKGKSYVELYGATKAKEIKKKCKKSHIGQCRPHKEETIKKIKKARAKQILPKKDTTIEVKIQNFLKQLGIEFYTHQYMKIEHGYQCDVLIPSMNLVIECDGDYWHKYPVGNDIDHIRTKELIEKGFKVLRIWEYEIRQMDINKFEDKLHGQ